MAPQAHQRAEPPNRYGMIDVLPKLDPVFLCLTLGR